ncbi:hypothetical protein D3C75_1303680 [compost metagenome]
MRGGKRRIDGFQIDPDDAPGQPLQFAYGFFWWYIGRQPGNVRLIDIKQVQ